MKIIALNPSPASITSIAFLQPYLVTMRPYLMFVSGITGITALAFEPIISTGLALAIATASFLSYGFGQALTDCFQIDTDSLSAPYRPLTTGILGRKDLFIFSGSGLAACILIFSCCHPGNLLLGIIAGIGLATYTPFKRRWWGGPFYNAWIVGVLFLMAFLAGGGSFAAMRSNDFVWAACATFFAYANFVVSGYFKDIDADRLTGYHTLPVTFGRRLSAYASDSLAILTLLPIILTIAPKAHLVSAVPSFVFALCGTAALALGQIRLHAITSDAEAHKAIVPILHSYLLLFSSIAVLKKPAWGVPLVLLYVSFAITLHFRPAREQI